MNKRVRINLAETSKEVKADVSIEYDAPAEEIDNQAILNEIHNLFKDTLLKAQELTMVKISMGKGK